jgi:23S rRNA (cytidine1920-2'-O)/16S rRNA (cytidine1409-2'-O)-methyltransferase
MHKTRLDLLLVERGMAESRSLAQALVMAGQVRVDGQVEIKASTSVSSDAKLTVDSGPRYVSRGGTKLAAALEGFPIQVEKRICADVGASTGGFTDCLLQHGAAKVYAIDVGKGILHWKLRSDERVIVMEETNARFIESLPEPVSFVTIDASFISLKILLPVVKNWFSGVKAGENNIVALIKPQFEAGRKESARHKGVIRNPELHQTILMDILNFAETEGLGVKGLLRSPVIGPKGNVEFLAWLEMGESSQADLDGVVQSIINPPL